MKISDELTIGPGEIWAVSGDDAASRSAWCAALARREEIEDCAALLSFAQHAGEAQRTGWPQARYYEDDGKTVAEFLSYNDVYDINPFEIGAKRPETRKSFKARQDRLVRLLDLRSLWDRLVIALSNGETRRVLLARALAKGPQLLILDDPAAGMDARQREKLKEILRALAARGMSIIVANRHDDELPKVNGFLKIVNGVVEKSKLKGESTKPTKLGRRSQADVADVAKPIGAGGVRRKSAQSADSAKPVIISISNLTLSYGPRSLFNNFSWTVREGEHWLLRGANGSGKTTLFALITGDSPLAYACDVEVFGQAREVGVELAAIRSRIGMVSPEMQAYLGKGALELIDEALAGNPELFLLDEPFMNLDEREARQASRRIEAYLKKHRSVTAILICHRADEAPKSFTKEIVLDE